ncbi:MAG TPA: hypothetical protein VIW68_12680 [Candidatus Sulfotelmatobacter sp.]
MAIKLTLLRVAAPAGSPREALVLITPSGNYTTITGDPLNLAQLFGQVSQEGLTLDSDQLPIEAVIESLAGGWGASGGGYYEAQLWTNPGNGNPATPLTLATAVLRLFAAGGAEQGTGAYPNTVLSDRIVMLLKYAPAV